jgi:hypothetical protein
MSDLHRLPEKWLPISIALAEMHLQVGVMGKDGNVTALVFPVLKQGALWVDASSKAPVDIGPTHWRPWNDGG